ncbi:MAG: cytochrome c [Isosphaeraceae bacterium]
MRWVLAWCALLVVGTVGLLGVRGMVADRRPLMLIPDMDDQPRYDPQAESDFFGDGRTMRTPPAGTVAFGGADYFSDAGSPRQDPDLLQADDRFYRGKQGDRFVERNPLPIDLAVLQRGRERYNMHCAICHGEAGYGDGIVTKYGFVGVSSYHAERVRAMSDGELYQIITNGKGLMMPYSPQVRPRDRWAIVAYVRALQRSQNATLADVPPEVRAEAAR